MIWCAVFRSGRQLCTFPPSISFLCTFLFLCFFSGFSRGGGFFSAPCDPQPAAGGAGHAQKIPSAPEPPGERTSQRGFRPGQEEKHRAEILHSDPSSIHPSIHKSATPSITPTQLHQSSFLLFLCVCVLSQFTRTAFVKRSSLKINVNVINTLICFNSSLNKSLCQ